MGVVAYYKVWQVLVPVVCLSQLLVVGLLVFSNGFLLTRQVVEKTSTSSDFGIKADSEGSWMPPSFKRAVVLIIDALRYDFAQYDLSLSEKDAAPYQNKLPIIRDILEEHPGEAMLVPLVADAPTTTMQRLKGLTTGSLPTFIDASHNFASEEISEDNIVDQLVRHGRWITFLGDDTWDGLFPNRFNQSFMFPSFNVMDLNTVDDGILAHLDGLLQASHWDMLVAHFLGVDHCGHRYGPNHPQMATKLTQMNQVIKNVASSIEEDTLLLVLGDHGMTRTGDHGGDSKDEVTTALFAFSPGLAMSDGHNPAKTMAMAQVDLVPSIALALGVPIPYSSLGTVRSQLLLTKGLSPEEGLEKEVLALSYNVKQVQRYLSKYQDLGNKLPPDAWTKLQEISANMSLGNASLQQRKAAYEEYLTLAKLTCEEVWAKFNILEMSSGLIFMLIVSVVMVVVLGWSAEQDQSHTTSRLLLLTIAVNVAFILAPFVGVSMVGFLGSALLLIWLYFYSFKENGSSLRINNTDIISLMIVILVCLGSFSNSYVVVENYVISFALVSLSVAQCIVCLMRRPKKKPLMTFTWKTFKSYLTFHNIICFLTILAILMAVRGSSSYWKCREEQYWCIPNEVHTPMTGLPEGLRNWRYFISVFALLLLVWLPRRWLVMCGNMNGSRIGVLLVSYVPVVAGMLVAAHWALQAAPQEASARKINIEIPARLNYCLILLYLGALYFLPLLIYEIPPKKNTVQVSDNPYSSVPQLYQTLVEKYHEGNDKRPNIPIVYGLATAISAPLVSVVVGLWIVAVMLAGDGLTPAMLFLFITSAACLMLQSIIVWTTANDLGNVITPSWSAVCGWFALSLHGFYATGHQPTFPTLHWSAAFVGFAGDWGGTTILPALLVGFNTFSSHIIFGLSLPLVVLAPLAIGVAFPKLRGSRLEAEEVSRGEFLLVDQPQRAKEALVVTALAYILLHAVKVICSTLCAFILRRHLMVWKIFAPHFIFEAVGFIVSSGSVIVGVCFTMNVVHKLLSWSERLQQKNT